jgi:hypothetical protein
MIKLTLLSASIFSIFSVVNDFQKDLPHPVSIKEDYARTAAKLALIDLNAPREKLEKLTNGVHAASVATKLDPILIASVIKPESGFKVSAKSSKNYKGLMQGDRATMKWGYAEADIVYGALILKEKIEESKGNVDNGMIHYKGHGGEESRRLAAKQMELYHLTKSHVEAQLKEKG